MEAKCIFSPDADTDRRHPHVSCRIGRSVPAWGRGRLRRSKLNRVDVFWDPNHKPPVRHRASPVQELSGCFAGVRTDSRPDRKRRSDLAGYRPVAASGQPAGQHADSERAVLHGPARSGRAARLPAGLRPASPPAGRGGGSATGRAHRSPLGGSGIASTIKAASKPGSWASWLTNAATPEGADGRVRSESACPRSFQWSPARNARYRGRTCGTLYAGSLAGADFTEVVVISA